MTFRPCTVAIVDDHPFFREVYARYLAGIGFTVMLEAGNGMELLQSLEACTPLPEACILDVEMPILDGIATAYALRERYPAIKVVVLTQSRDEAKKMRMLKAVALGVLFKGMDDVEMKEALYDMLCN